MRAPAAVTPLSSPAATLSLPATRSTSDCGAVGNVANAEPSGHGFTHDDSNLTAKTTLEAGMDNDCGRYFGADNGTLAEALSSGYVPKESWMPPLKNLFRVQMVLQNGDAFSISSCPAR